MPHKGQAGLEIWHGGVEQRCQRLGRARRQELAERGGFAVMSKGVSFQSRPPMRPMRGDARPDQG